MRKTYIVFLIFFILLATGYIFNPRVEAYDNKIIHPLLTEKIAELYNYVYEPDLTDEEIQSLMAGSTDEDTAPRWINHFYDPTTGLGWSGKRLGDIPQETVMTAALIAFGKKPVSAVDWAQDQDLQNSQYSLYQGNRTLNSAVLYYLEGKNQEAYYSLGYILHLVEDMAVPAHTRQDTHFDMSTGEIFEQILGVKPDKGEPYEKWVEENGDMMLDLMDGLKKNYQPICSSLESCLIYLANYSNNNLFSQDSILDKEYTNPKVVKYTTIDDITYAYDKNGYLLFMSEENPYRGEVRMTIDNSVYWKNLSPVAILAGVEVVKYFHEQAEKAKNNEITIIRPEKISFLKKVQTISTYGEFARLWKLASFASMNLFSFWDYSNQDDEQVKNQSPNLLTDLGITPEEAQERADDLQELLDLLNNREGGNNFAWPSLELPSLPSIEPPSLEPPTLGLPTIGLPSLELPPLLQTSPQNQPQTPVVVTYTGGGGGGGTSYVVYPKILISEIQVLPTEQRFVELYNPNNQEVNLTGWYIQRKTSTGASWESFVSSPKFEGKTIPANDYFLISRQIENSDIVLDITLSDNNSLILKNPNQEIVDKVGWGQAQEFETIAAINPNQGKSVGRKWISDAEQETDNNSADFEIQIPTPKAKNVLFTPPPPVPPPPNKILITEVQIEGEKANNDFIELYNPNESDLDISDFKLRKRTSTGTESSVRVFSQGTKIPSKSYFLWANSEDNFHLSLGADTWNTATLAKNNSIALLDSKGVIIDALAWGESQTPFVEGTAFTQNPGKNQSSARKIVDNGYKDTDDNSADFEIQNPTPKAKNVPIPPPTPPTDNKAPSVVFNLAATQESLNFSINFEITDLSMENVSPSGLAVFQFRWKEGETGEWQEDPSQEIVGRPTSHNLIREFAGEDEKTYYFQVKAKDVNENESVWLPETPIKIWVRTPKTILINEIQIDGIIGAGGTDDDWVELYNPYDIDVSSAGWSIQEHSKDDPCSINTGFSLVKLPDNSIIPAHGFYLIIDVDANDALKNIADITVNWLLTDNNTIYLVRNQEKIENGDDPDIIDKIGFGLLACFPETAPAPNPPEAGSIERKLIGVDTNNNSQDFRISAVSTPMGRSPLVTISDITDYYMCESGSSPGTNYYNLTIKWQSVSNISFYQVQYKKNDNEWQDWFSQTTNTQGMLRAPQDLFHDNIYYFRVRGQDTDGNLGDWVQISVDASMPVVINEAALFGTNASTDDQWIELYNKSNRDIDLTGWKIRGGWEGVYSFYLELQGMIPSGGYFILEKNDNESISDVSASQLFTSAIRGYAYLYLANEKNRKIDSLYFPGYPGWQGSSFLIDGNYHSMERISPFAFGYDNFNWKINNGQIINGHDRNGSPIYGTPGQQNSNYQLYTPISTDFVENATLTKDLSPYLFHGGNIEVFSNTTLIIEPGVIIKFTLGGGLFVKGTLKAIGTPAPEDQILFTSFYDPAYPGYWRGIHFTKESVNSELENIVVQYAGVCWPGYPYGGCNLGGAGIRVEQTSISLKNSTIAQNLNNGLWLTNSSSIIDSVQILDHQLPPYDGINLGAKGIFVEGGSPIITNSNFERNYYGIYMQSWYKEDGTVIPAVPYIDATNTFGENGTDIWPVPTPPPPPPESP